MIIGGLFIRGFCRRLQVNFLLINEILGKPASLKTHEKVPSKCCDTRDVNQSEIRQNIHWRERHRRFTSGHVNDMWKTSIKLNTQKRN